MLDLEKLEEEMEKACIDKADLFDFYNENWNKLIEEIRTLRIQHPWYTKVGDATSGELKTVPEE